MACDLSASFAYSLDGCEATFSASATSSAAIVSWEWDFGDGGTSTDQNPTHTFAAPDTIYTVTLTVTDADGCVVETSQEISCTSCTDCPDGLPATVTVAIDGTLGGGCGNCAYAIGTFVLDYYDEPTGFIVCGFQYIDENTCCTSFGNRRLLVTVTIGLDVNGDSFVTVDISVSQTITAGCLGGGITPVTITRVGNGNCRGTYSWTGSETAGTCTGAVTGITVTV